MDPNTAEAKHLLAFIESYPSLTSAELLAAVDVVEVWRLIAGWPYEVSSWGKVRRVGGALLAFATTHGYAHVTLADRSRKKSVRVHVLVANAFLGPPPFAGAQVAHNDGVQENFRARNLRWTNALDNQADRKRHGTKIVGSKVFGAKLQERMLPEIRERLRAGERYPTIAADYGVSISTISLINKGATWRHTAGEQAA